MRIRIISVGKQMPSWVNEGFKTYQQRMGRDMPVELVEIGTQKRHKHTDIKKLIEQEGKAMLAAIKAQEHVIAMDVRGKRLSTESMASQLGEWQHDGRDLCLLIGGPEGLADSALQRANSRWSMSDLTLPHPLVRVVLMEQLYRAWSVIHGLPYHRA